MILKDFPAVEKAGEVVINCNSCINNASLSNKECIDCISKKLSSDSERLVLIKGAFKKVYNNPREDKQLPAIMPSFIKSRLINFSDSFKTIEEYSVKGAKVSLKSNGIMIIYCIDPHEMHLSKDDIIKTSAIIKKLQNKELVNLNFKKSINKFLAKEPISSELKEVVYRHTLGFGLIDILFNDDKIQDVFVDSPGNKLVHIVHSKYNECLTNLVISKRDVLSIGTKVRAVSGRPFDESFPVINYDLDDYDLRVCGICEPLTFNGTGYAFRKHKKSPWTIPEFVANEMISAEAAGLISFLVDGQASILITGPRGSGKTAILSALVTEVPRNSRILLIEDTPELPVDNLENAGFKIQHVRIKSSFRDDDNYELNAEQALRTSLRLGESVLVMGEVRGSEAKALFEAMRVGAAGNTVIGTIHGSSAYDTYDRVVNDLSVPKSSFKATDIIISCANLRIGESLSRLRRVTSIVEVKKEWVNDPLSEGGFFELTKFDRKKMKLSLSSELEQSSLIARLSELKGMGTEESIKSIKLRGQAKELMAKLKVSNDPSFTARSNDKLRELLSSDYRTVLKKFRNWLLSEKQENTHSLKK